MSGIRVELELDTGEFTSRVLHAGESLQQFNRSVGAGIVSMRAMETSSRSVLSTLRDLSIVIGIGSQALNTIRQVTTGWVGDIVRVNAEMERMSVLMRTLSRASDPVREAAENVRYLRTTALSAPYSLQALSDVFVKLKSTGIDPTKGALMSLVDGVAAFGGTEETLKRATIAIQQMAGKGVIQMEELRQQLGEAIPRATELMARGLGVAYSKLVADIATGRVEATTALKALEVEMRNVFGGAAQEQMNTFTGLVSTIGTSFQDLAIKVGNTGFFDNLKRQLSDLRTALSSNAANVLANDIGKALNTTVTILRDVVDWVIRYRQEIMNVGQAVLYAFGGTVVIRSILSMSSGIAGLITQYRLLQGSIAAASLGIQMSSAAGAAGLSGMTIAARSLWAALIPIGGVLGVVAGWLPLVVGGAVAAAGYFGLFSDKLKETYQDAQKYGIQTRQQADDVAKYLDRKEQELDQIIKMRDARLAMWNEQGGRHFRKAISEAFDPEIEARQAEVDKLRAEKKKLNEDFEGREAQRGAQTRVDAINKQIADEQRAYDSRAITLKQAYEKERVDTAAKNKSVAELDQRYGEESRRISMDLLDRKIELYQGYYDELAKQAQSDVESQRRAAQLALDTIRPILNQLYDDRAFKRSQSMGTPLIQPTLDDDKLYKKGQQALANLNAEVVGLKASLRGANAEVVELNQKLIDGKYGDADVKRVRELIDALVMAKAEKEALDEVMQGRKKFDTDVRNLMIKFQEEILDAQTQGLSEVDKLFVRINSGLYKGVGNGQTPLQKSVQDVTAQLGGANTAAAAAGVSIRTNAFGSATLSAGNTFVSVVDKANEAWSRLRTNIEGTNPASVFQKLAAGGQAFGMWQNAVGAPDYKPTSTSPQPNEQAAVATVDPLLQKVIELARTLSPVGFNIVEGARSIERQKEMVASGKSMTMNSNHLTGSAFDFVAVDANGKRTYDEALMRTVADAFKAAAKQLGLGVNWGGDWQKFKDTPHVELQSQYRPVNKNDSQLPIPSNMTQEQQASAAQLRQLEQRANAEKFDAGLKKAIDDLKTSITEVGDAAEGTNKRVAAMRKSIADGKYGDNKNPDSDRYKELLKLAGQLDAAETAAAKKKRDRTIADTATEGMVRSQEDLASRSEAAMRRIFDPQQLKSSDAFFRKQKELAKQTDAIGNYFGFDSDTYKRALADATNQLQEFRNLEVREAVASYAQQNQELKRSLMTESQARQDETAKEIDRARKVLEAFRGTAEERAQIEEVVQTRIALLRAKAAQQGPWAQQLKEWGDLWGNMEKSATNALNSVTDQIAELVTTGKADFASMFQSIAKDMVKQFLNFSVSSLLGNMGGKTGGGSGVSIMELLAKIGAKLFGGFRAAGGPVRSDKAYVVGEKGPELFAPGMRGSIIPHNLLRSIQAPSAIVNQSVTPQNVQAMTFAPTIQFQGNGGSHAENRDLSDQMVKGMRSMVREEMFEFLRKQHRFNGAMGT